MDFAQPALSGTEVITDPARASHGSPMARGACEPPGRDSKLHDQLQDVWGLLTMGRVSVSEFRRDAVAVIRKVPQGKHLVRTHRGRPAISLEPLHADAADPGNKI